ncbi:2-keto-3-deoxygluconate kinase [Pseudaminobacter salicylatoxidans]|uniref:2-keto-3-deoxygluconate kinase n=1 Tax=Pseudaminobacter salicylatoxidans TaxID=93369 RepID=A0A316BUK6_PSESE|nr:sugar kinase [Pseudaminobacter salicylatoxidans]PWJ76963.1 2-keto-3-deoxygluconate kinase [Pseudaminobacter salicylatoxidans]
MADGIAAIGECMIELSGQTGHTWRMGYAGDTFNTLWTIRALSPSHHVDYVTAFGNDPFSQEQIAFFREHDIGVASSPVVPGARPGLYAIRLEGAERSFTYWRSDAAARQLASNPIALAKSLEERTLIYFSGITLAILDTAGRRTLLQAIAAARAHGCHVAFDPNYRPRLWPDTATARAAIDEGLKVADLALPTFADEQDLYGDASPEATLERLERAGVAESVVKNGEREVVISHYENIFAVPATRVEAPIDTTGAGDAFNGAYLSARLLGQSPKDAARRAHRVAAAVVQVRGALAPFEILRLAFEL